MSPLLFRHLGDGAHSSNTSAMNGVTRLTPSQCSRRDAGTCLAESGAGRAPSRAELHVKGKGGLKRRKMD